MSFFFFFFSCDTATAGEWYTLQPRHSLAGTAFDERGKREKSLEMLFLDRKEAVHNGAWKGSVGLIVPRAPHRDYESGPRTGQLCEMRLSTAFVDWTAFLIHTPSRTKGTWVNTAASKACIEACKQTWPTCILYRDTNHHVT